MITDDILDKALELAEAGSWESVRMYNIASELGIGLDEISRHYQQKDDLAEALFNRADQVMLSEAAKDGFDELSGRKRIHRVIMAWLSALAPHRRATIDILKYKLEFGHIHLQVLGVLRVSRTVQWMLESVGSKTESLSRIAEEVGATSVFLTTLGCWLTDHTEGYARTEKLLDSLLCKSENLASIVNPLSVVAEPATRQKT